jgi:long-chain acyl-CoA synthetase
MDPLFTIVDVLNTLQAQPANSKALNEWIGSEWQSLSTEEILKQVEEFALGLVSIGIKPGECVGILAQSSPSWTIADLAIMSIGAITVPLFANISDGHFTFEVFQTSIKHILVSPKEAGEHFWEHSSHFDTIIFLDQIPYMPPNALKYTSVLERGTALNIREPNLYAKLKQAITPDALATIVYTSGSTGLPKGAEITHQALVSLMHEGCFNWNSKQDSYLNVLPLAHIFGRVINLFLLTWGVSIYYCTDIKQMGAFCSEIHPTVLVLVPRILEKLYAKMLFKVDQENFVKRAIGHWAFDIASADEESLIKTMVHPIFDKTVYSSIRDALGGNLRVVLCGGANLDPHLCRFFIDIGIPLYQGWGLTEASTVSVNTPTANKIGTVGRALEGIQVKLSSENELLVKGKLMMRGYYKNPEATSESIDADGWLHTGDIGTIDEEGYISVQARMKEIYKTSTGENIVPAPIERMLCRAPLIDMALVVGHNRQFASCLLFPDLNVLHSLKTLNAMDEKSDEEFLQSPFITEEVNKLIETVNSGLDHWEQIHAYRFILTPLTIYSGELTPSMKICRNVVLNKYSDLINEIYAQTTSRIGI